MSSPGKGLMRTSPSASSLCSEIEALSISTIVKAGAALAGGAAGGVGIDPDDDDEPDAVLNPHGHTTEEEEDESLSVTNTAVTTSLLQIPPPPPPLGLERWQKKWGGSRRHGTESNAVATVKRGVLGR